mmetsp:Transcript_31588/g.34532  ORF Transcript_31588/g.34532 Transcript_31588/m.34532 type:complete len:267 (-) Transcript_31588:1950-2750(-)
MNCYYGHEERRNHVLVEYHLLSLILTLSMTLLLFRSEKLRRVYAPLSNIVNFSLVLRMCSALLFFMYYPYKDDNSGNCAEKLVGRIGIVLIMFGEMHQIYFIANVLGVSRYRFKLGLGLSIALETTLLIATTVMVVTVLSTMVFFQSIMVFRSIWTLFIISLQLHFISYARDHNRRGSDPEEHSIALIDANHEVVNIFEMLSWLQIIPTLISFLYRLIELSDYHQYHANTDAVMMTLEVVGAVFFYIKVIILQEKGSAVSVEIVED